MPHQNCKGTVSGFYVYGNHIFWKPDDHQSSWICHHVVKCQPKPIQNMTTLESNGTHLSSSLRCHVLWSTWRTPTFQLCLHGHGLQLLWDPLGTFKGHTNFLTHHQKDYALILHLIGTAQLHYWPSKSNWMTGTWYQGHSFSEYTKWSSPRPAKWSSFQLRWPYQHYSQCRAMRGWSCMP